MRKIFDFTPDSLSLKTRFALVSFTLFLLAVWGMAGYVAYKLQRDLEHLLAEHQRAMADSIAQSIASSVRLRRESLVMLSSNIRPEEMHNTDSLIDLVMHHQDMRQLFDVGLAVTTPEGKVLAKYPPDSLPDTANANLERLSRTLAESMKFSIGPPAPNTSGTQATIVFAAPIIGNEKKVLGSLFGTFSLRANEFIDEETDLTSDIGYLVISRASRLILAARDKSRIMHPAPNPGGNILLDQFLEGYEGSGISVNSRGIEELSSGKRVQGTDWVVAITMPTQDAFAPVVQMRKRVFASAAILSLVVALLTWFFARKTMRPLEHLIESVRKMGTPDAALQQLALQPSGPEIAELLDAFNRMQQRIADQAAVLTENEARFHFIADHSPILIWISDKTGRPIWFNQTWLKMTSRSLEQLHAGAWSDVIHPDDRDQYMESIEQGLVSKASVRTKFRMCDAGDSFRWFMEIAVPRFVDGNGFAGYVGSCLDIDEQVVAQNRTEALLNGNRKLMAERFNIEESEHRRLARDLHDDLGQWLTAISVNAEAICAIAGGEGEAKVHHCAASIVTSTAAIQDFVRAMNRKLGSDTLTTLGLKESLVELVTPWRVQHGGVVTELAFDDSLDSLDKHLELTVFRLVKEALTNIARHAKATRVGLALHRKNAARSDALLLSIVDDGIGFDINHDTRGVGLIGMRERTVALGGSCVIRSEPRNGTSVEIHIPLGQESSSIFTANAHSNA